MPPAKRTHEDPQSLKEKLHSLQGGNGRGRRNGKEVMSNNGDNASTNSGQNEHTSGVSASRTHPSRTTPQVQPY
jgi:histone deacetylase complex subunit SAP30